MGGRRVFGVLIASAVLAGCGVTPPHQTFPVAPAPAATSPSAGSGDPATPPGGTESPEPVTNSPTPQDAEASLIAEVLSPEPEPLPSASALTPPESPVSTPTSQPEPPVTALPPQASGKVNCRKAKCIALTFDDGPGPYTTKLLSHLEQANVPATFFVLGQKVKAYPKVARAIAAAGHEIGVHTWDHRMLTKLSAAQVRREITSSIKIVKKTTGKTPKLMRPPYGETNATVAIEARQAKVAQILWDVDTLDWKTRSTKKTVKSALKLTKRGSVLLLHDIHATSVAAVPGIIEGLRKKGYTFVTVSQLLGKTKPGARYFHG